MTDLTAPSGRSLRDNAWRIWLAALDAVRADRLVERAIQRDGDLLLVDDLEIDLRRVKRIAVVGAGKAGAGMAAGLENVLGDELLAAKQLTGLVNVPADCVRALKAIHLNAARPAGVNEPRPEGVAGTQAMLDLVSKLGPNDLCIALISGGGSALLPAPADGITLADKLAVTRVLSAAGANIEQLNIVRKQLSQIKGGGLARACSAGRLIALIISDVLGDPLDVIASGPTVQNRTTAADAIRVLEEFGGEKLALPTSVYEFLRRRAEPHESPADSNAARCHVTNVVIGNNAVAVDAAGMEAERLGYRHAMHAATTLEGDAEEVGRHLAQMARTMMTSDGPNCLITGGEPVVRLAPADRRGLGGRNQQLVLAALEDIQSQPVLATLNSPGTVFALLSAGTDGEDGPTDAAGAVVDAEVIAAAARQQLDPADYLARNDAYHFFAATGGLLKTGPTHTNVCDVRVLVVKRNGD
jgi:glycerate 2-kinase